MFKKDFPIFATHSNLVFLDSASSTQKPAMVIEGMKQYFETNYSNIHRGAYDLSMNSSELYDQSKRKFAEFIGADSHNEIVYTYNATYALNLIARGLAKTGILKKGNKILLSEVDHHANIVPWQIIAEEYGIEILWTRAKADGTIDYVDIENKIHDVKLISITGASNVSGEILDLEKMSEILSKCEKKPLFVLDASQRFPHLATDVKKYGIDIRSLYNKKICVIGSGSGEALNKYGVNPDFIPSRFDSKSFLDEILPQLDKSSKVLMLRAKLGSDVLPNGLKSAGIGFSDIPIYDTVIDYRKKFELNRNIESFEV